jgi:hypothetical protein
MRRNWKAVSLLSENDVSCCVSIHYNPDGTCRLYNQVRLSPYNSVTLDKMIEKSEANEIVRRSYVAGVRMVITTMKSDSSNL